MPERTIRNSILLFLRVWPLATVSCRFTAAEHCAGKHVTPTLGRSAMPVTSNERVRVRQKKISSRLP